MSVDGAFDRRRDQTQAITAANGNGVLVSTSTATAMVSTHRLKLNPNTEHKPDSYEDLSLTLKFNPLLFSCLERYLPPSIISASRDSKAQFMSDILLKYSPEGERIRVRLVYD